jgi:hypothetical protein
MEYGMGAEAEAELSHAAQRQAPLFTLSLTTKLAISLIRISQWELRSSSQLLIAATILAA